MRLTDVTRTARIGQTLVATNDVTCLSQLHDINTRFCLHVRPFYGDLPTISAYIRISVASLIKFGRALPAVVDEESGDN